jgi:adenosylhomocysteine nucleosidase
MSDYTPDRDPAHADVGIVCALRREVAPLLERCDRVRKYQGGDFTFWGGFTGPDYEIRIVIVAAGTGTDRASRATRALLDAHTPVWVVSAGFAGALRPELRVGDIVMADALIDPAGRELRLDVRMAPQPESGWHVGRVATVENIVRSVAEKHRLGEQTHALAVDMESFGVAEACLKEKRRCLAVRTISDDMSADLPPEVLSVLGSTGSIRAGAVVGAIWKRPSSVKEMWRLREQAVYASQSLASFLQGVIVRLYESAH